MCGNHMQPIFQVSILESYSSPVPVCLLTYFRLRNTDLPVKVSKTLQCSLGGKQRLINVQVSADVQTPTFKKDGSNILYMLPSSFAILENGNNHYKN